MTNHIIPLKTLVFSLAFLLVLTQILYYGLNDVVYNKEVQVPSRTSVAANARLTVDTKSSSVSPVEESVHAPIAVSNNECPLVFGFGHQKSGTTTIVMVLGSIANYTARNDVFGFWDEKPLTDAEVLKAIHPKAGLIQKEGHAMVYMEQMARVCPQMRYYVVRRDALTVVRSVADRLGIDAKSICTSTDSFPSSWRSLFDKSNDTSCLVRIAASVRDYETRVQKFAHDHVVEEIFYEDYLKDRIGSMRQLCHSLQVLGPCNGTKLDTKQYQSAGKNRNKNLTDIWPADVIERLQAMVALK